MAWNLTSAPLVSFMGAACSRACDSIDKYRTEGRDPPTTKEVLRTWPLYIELRRPNMVKFRFVRSIG